MRSLYCLIFLFFAGIVISAQKSQVTAEADFFDAALTVVKLPAPNYPAEAKKSGLSGVVSVKVTVDKTGKVISVDDAEGPYPVCKAVTDQKVLAMRAAAIEAAKRAKFKSAISDYKKANISGLIRYNFGTNVEASPVEGVGARVASRATKLEEVSENKVTAPGKSDNVAKVDNSAETDNSGTTDEPPQRITRAANPPTLSLPLDSVADGVLNRKAVVLAKPEYPTAALAHRVFGQVSVQVLIDEQGNIYSARAVSGHPFLRRNSEIAACESRFSPTLLSGQTVKVSGIITYNFLP